MQLNRSRNNPVQMEISESYTTRQYGEYSGKVAIRVAVLHTVKRRYAFYIARITENDFRDLAQRKQYFAPA